VKKILANPEPSTHGKGFYPPGEPKPWRHTSPKGIAVISWFCGDCGARLYGDRAGRAEIVNLRAGTLDETKWLVPIALMFMRSAQPWVSPAANAECHEICADDFRPLAAAWRARWSEFFP
jgi:hypothetical protein